jgi:hypothetical protein
MSSMTAPTVERRAYQKYAVDVQASPIDGHGVFAAESIPARAKIGEIRGEAISVEEARIRATRHERIMIVELSARRAIDFTKSTDPMRFTNHSCRPVDRQRPRRVLCAAGDRDRRRAHRRLRRDAPRWQATLPLRRGGLSRGFVAQRSRAAIASR